MVTPVSLFTSGSIFTSARWADATRREIVALRGDGTVCLVPADPGNADYALILAGDANRTIAPLGIAPHAPPVPALVTNYQARAVLIGAGLFDAVDQAIRASGQPLAVNAWDYANQFDRDSAFIASFGAILDLDDAAIDELFRQADAVA